MRYLNFTIEELNRNGGIHTAKEICSQPEMWELTYLKLKNEKESIVPFLDNVLKREEPHVILTGAGSSAFIGETLVGVFQKKLQIPCRAIGTTEIITHPENYFIKSKPTLLISFARSGDSPESVSTIELARKYCDHLFELNITCNKDGELAKHKGEGNSYTFILPEETNDRSLAMTSSFSSMLLAGLLILNIQEIELMAPLVKNIQHLANSILSENLTSLKEIAIRQCERMIFLGSGPFFGIAHESHLKVQEMTDGNTICKFDSFLGFRHGPKVVVNDSTIIIYLLSNNPYSNRYELDLISSVKNTNAGEVAVAIGSIFSEEKPKLDYTFEFTRETADIPEEFLAVFYILPAQIIGFFKSLALGLSPDAPSKSNSISRVVQGVKIYQNK